VEDRLKPVIRVGDLRIGRYEKAAIRRVLESGRISEGPVTRAFEQRWADFIGTRYCVATSSGSGALITALTALKYKHGFKDGAKAIVTPLTYAATLSALIVTGFEPVFVDVEPDTFCLDADKVEAVLRRSRDRASYKLMLPVDLIGYMPRMDRLRRLAARYKLALLEDAAEAHGSVYGDRRAGAWGDAGIFSFYIAHNIQAGEMGTVTTDDREIYTLCKKIKAQGRACVCPSCTRHEGRCPLNRPGVDADPRFTHDVIGYNFKTMEFPAALALTQMERAEKIIRKRQDNVRILNAGLAPFAHLLQLPVCSRRVSYLAYPVIIRDPRRLSRRDLCRGLEKRGIENRYLFGCLPLQQPAFAAYKEKAAGTVPVAEKLGAQGLYLGCHQYLSRNDLRRIIAAFTDILKGL